MTVEPSASEQQHPAPVTTPPAPTAGDRAPVLGFFLDLLIGAALLVVMGFGGSLLWGVWRGVSLAIEARRVGTPLSGAQLAQLAGQPGVLAQLLIALLSTATPALVLYFWRRRASAAERSKAFAALRQPGTWGRIVAVAVAVFFFSNGVSWVAEQLHVKLAPTNLPLMEQALTQWPLFLVLFAVVLAPCYEELLFRRVLFGRLAAAGRPWLGLVLSSLAFALLHEVPGVSGNGPSAIVQLWLVYGVMGAAFAWLYWRTGSLWASICAHALNNATALLVMHLFGQG